MITINFKNGTKKDISEEIFKIISAIILEGCANFQVFSDQDNVPFLIINMSEIVCITYKDYK